MTTLAIVELRRIELHEVERAGLKREIAGYAVIEVAGHGALPGAKVPPE